MDTSNNTPESEQLKQLNIWLIWLVVFIVVWSVGMMVYVKQTDTKNKEPFSTSIVTSTVDKTNEFYNLFKNKTTNTNASIVPLYIHKESYEIMEYVVINYFFISGIVIEKHDDGYIILYKDDNKILHKVKIAKELLLYPSIPVFPQ